MTAAWIAVGWATASTVLGLFVGAFLRAGGRPEVYDITADAWDDSFELDVAASALGAPFGAERSIFPG